ncbi:MAG: NMD3-related protein [Patescibacteria group bacterium]
MPRQQKYRIIEQPPRRREEHEIPKGKSGLIFCRKCNIVYYKKSWHHNLRSHKKIQEDLAIGFTICPACEMIKNKQFEGEIIVQNAPPKIIGDLTRLVEKFGQRAYKRDPLDRLIEIKNVKEGIKITTTENQLAVKIAKKIKDVFKKIKIKITYSPAPSDVAYIKLMFGD